MFHALISMTTLYKFLCVYTKDVKIMQRKKCSRLSHFLFFEHILSEWKYRVNQTLESTKHWVVLCASTIKLKTNHKLHCLIRKYLDEIILSSFPFHSYIPKVTPQLVSTEAPYLYKALHFDRNAIYCTHSDL